MTSFYCSCWWPWVLARHSITMTQKETNLSCVQAFSMGLEGVWISMSSKSTQFSTFPIAFSTILKHIKILPWMFVKPSRHVCNPTRAPNLFYVSNLLVLLPSCTIFILVFVPRGKGKWWSISKMQIVFSGLGLCSWYFHTYCPPVCRTYSCL